MPSSNKISTYFVQSLDRALDILSCFTFNQPQLTQSQIVMETGLNRTTAMRLLSNLTGRGFLKYSHEDRLYRLGNKIFELGGVALSSISLRTVANPHISRLRDKIKQTVILGLRLEDDLVYIDKREGGQGIEITTSLLGRRKPLHYGMLGAVMMAYLPHAEQEQLLEKDPLIAYTPKSITDKNAFLRDLMKTRKNGYHIAQEDIFEGLGGISAPIRNHKGEVFAAVGFAIILSLLDSSGKKKEMIREVMDTAAAITEDLAHLNFS